MKKVIFIMLVAAFSVASVNAQLNFGVKAGLNASTINGFSEFEEGFSLDATYRPGFHIGVAAQCMFTPQMGIETGLYYSTLGINTGMKMLGIELLSMNVNTSYLQLPVSFLYKFNVGQDLDIYPSVGIYLGYGLDGKLKVKSDLPLEDLDVEIPDDVSFFDSIEKGGLGSNRFDMGATIGLNLQYSKFTIGVGYDLGFLKINNKDSETPKDWTNGNVKVSVGYFF